MRDKNEYFADEYRRLIALKMGWNVFLVLLSAFNFFRYDGIVLDAGNAFMFAFFAVAAIRTWRLR